MTERTQSPDARRLRQLKLLMLQIAILSLTACGGGGYGGNDAPAAPAPPLQAEARFSEDTIEGLGFAVQDGASGKTDATGTFKVTQGKRVDFFVGDGTNRVVIGSASPTVTSTNAISFSLHDLTEVQGNNGDQVLGNVVGFLGSLDANGDISDGIQIDATANTAVAQAIAGHSLSFGQNAAQFAADPIVAGILAALHRNPIDVKEILAQFTLLFRQSRSSSIALTGDDKRAVVVNRQKNTASIIRVRKDDGTDSGDLLAEVPVGKEPRSVAVSPDDKRAYVTNAIDGTVTVIDLTTPTPQSVGQAVNVGVEPRGIAVTPNGTYAFVANHTEGDVAVIRLSTMEVLGHVHTGGNPYAVAITNDGDRNDLDERVFVTELFGEIIDPTRPDGFDDAKQGVVAAFRVGDAVQGTAQVTRLLLKPLASGFAADRRNFCLNTRRALQDAGTAKFFNSGALGVGDGASQLAKDTFCPDVNSNDAAADGPIAKNPQKVYPNMLFGALVRGSSLYIPNVGAQPEPPVRFNVNVQALVGVIDHVHDVESPLSVNLNSQVAKETQPAAGVLSLDRLFLNDTVAIDADRRGKDFLVVSRGGNFVIRAKRGADGKLTILDGANKAQRLQTGNLPSGVVMSRNGKRAYTNNELSTSVTALNLETNTVLAQDIESSTPPAPGTVQHRRLLGKLAFFTALGLPDKLDENGDGTFDVPLRSINPLAHRNKASDNGWSSCGSCHDDGHSDNVTWIFETGPRQTIPLEGTFARNDLTDQRILNWSGVRGSNTDFNNNARGIQGGKGFATDVGGQDRSAQVFNHGPTQGISDSLDALSEWVATVRAPIVPALTATQDTAGRTLFATNCASCHGGQKWTKSRTSPVYANNSTFPEDPIGVNFFLPVKPLDTGVVAAGPQIVSVTRDVKGTLKLLDNVGTFSAASPIELRGAAAVAGQSTQGFVAFGAAGFNTPSLLGLSTSSPYFHDGSAIALEDVATRHLLDGGQTIAQKLSATDLAALLTFVRGIDESTATVESDTDRFLK
ncbi:MAG: beta-propeller fold lactonase family protein [Gammaproteobacteria bacterium]